MNAWDIYSYRPPIWNQAHPAVIVSHPSRVANKPEVSILMCTSQKTNRPPDPSEVILDREDGLEWPTFCKCDLIHAVFKSDLTNHRGHVTAEGRRRIVETINRSNGWV